MNNVFNAVIGWVVPFLLGALVSLATSLLVRQKAIKNGLQCLLRAEIIRSSDKYCERNCAPIYAKEATTMAYKAYHALGGNDVATSLYHKIMALPDEPPGGGENEK